MNKQAIELNRIAIPREVLALVPPAMARRLQAIPIEADEDRLSVVLADVQDDVALTQIEAHTQRTVQAFPVRHAEELDRALQRYYPANIAVDDGSPLAVFEGLVHRALQQRCSDIHIDPDDEGGCVRLRIDGLLRVDRTLNEDLARDLALAVKVAANLDIAEKRAPQDGQINLSVAGEDIAMRVATVPTIHGEKVTLRILATAAVDAELTTIDALGMDEIHLAMFRRALGVSHGLVLLSGPTGSGKTTTLYAALRDLQAPGVHHIVSIEDPVEIPLPGITQVHVDSERVSFNGALRSVLRHDPDIIMIGEIRDAETADIAVKSAMTGHLVFSTLHTNDAIGVISRLLNLGVPRDQLASTLRLSVAQRLVRVPCPHCVEWGAPESRLATLFGDLLDGEASYPIPKGCSLCAGTGYAGRTGLYEMIPLTATLREGLLARATDEELARVAFAVPCQRTLQQDGLIKAARGRTTLAEVQRVTYTGET
jgi:type IV pilus assembly protein PilB